MKKKKPFNFTEDIIQNLIYTNITIGTPYQKIKSYISLNKGAFYISDYYIPKQFNINLSEIFNFQSNDINFYDEDFTKGKLSKDILQFKNIKGNNLIISNISFIYATNYNNFLDQFPSGLGFMLKTISTKINYNFLYQLKENNLISSYTFTIKFQNEKYGEIIIGDYPHIYNNNYILSNFAYTKISDFDNFFQWKFQIEKIYNNEEIIENKVDFIISINYGICIGGENYLKIINNTFFKEYVETSKLGLTPQAAGAVTQLRAFATVYQEIVEAIMQNKALPDVLDSVLQPHVEFYKKNLKGGVVIPGRIG
jgi:hypothetical protein